ncbi:hypothetical protein ROLI_019710 [Roseobacter fucihabitans]|uniref:Uncharacterized protein n=1 Tax=Roseobacter fucihabitans TaxID=1537242 RepID=A0ABZ2BSC1_9RHOB|nr:hypothetical protein [Roseobacter litoralis]MBC6966185.1 hypothetical protein [Roseobacter litoralis]
MSEIEDLQTRIMSALDRVATGVDAFADAEDIDALKTALEDEKTVNAELNEQVRELGERQAAALEALEARAAATAARMDQFDQDLQRLRRANAQLGEACEALRAANAEGVGEPELINQAMIAELDALRAARSAEISQADEIIAALTPLLEAGAPQTQETA